MTLDFESFSALPKSKVRHYLFVLVILGLAVYFLLPRVASMQNALVVLSTLRLPFVFLALGAQILSYLGSGYLLRSLIQPPNKSLSLFDGALITLAANSVGTLGGGVLGTAGMTYLLIRRREINRGVAALTSWLPIYLNNFIQAVVSLAGLFILVFLKKSSGLLAVGFTFVGLTFVAGAGLWWVFKDRKKLYFTAAAIMGFVSKLLHKAEDHSKVEAAVDLLFEGWGALLQKGWREPTVAAVLNIAFDMLSLRLLFMAAGCDVSSAVFVAGYGVPQLLGKLTFTLGGIGVVESSMAGLYTIMNVPKATAIIVVLGYRLISFWVPTLLGVALVPYLERNETRVIGETAR
jgi:hypothetical protein